jgi:hypothetical protein
MVFPVDGSGVAGLQAAASRQMAKTAQVNLTVTGIFIPWFVYPF